MRLLELLDTYFPRFVTDYIYLDADTGEELTADEIKATLPDSFVVLEIKYFNFFSYMLGCRSTSYSCTATQPRS